jgi:transcriptional regulator of heat shock response
MPSLKGLSFFNAHFTKMSALRSLKRKFQNSFISEVFLVEMIIGKTSKISPLQGLIYSFNASFTKMPALQALF